MVYINNSNELYHYGVKGMRWGHRKNNPTAYGGSITKNGKYKASNGVVIAKSRNAGVAAGRRFSTSLAGRALSAVGSAGMSKQQRAQLKKQQDALREYQKVGGDKMLRKQAQEKYRQTEEYKAQRAKVVKVGAAVAGTALAAYGAYKVSKILKDKASTRSYEYGKAAMERWMASAKRESQRGNWENSSQFYAIARDVAANADRRTDRVKNSTVEAAKYLYKTRGGRWAGV